MPYIARVQASSFCPGCAGRVTLLCHSEGPGMPAFYICSCGFIGQVGVKMIRKPGTIRPPKPKKKEQA
jgi:hypothetical protein